MPSPFPPNRFGGTRRSWRASTFLVGQRTAISLSWNSFFTCRGRMEEGPRGRPRGRVGRSERYAEGLRGDQTEQDRMD
eukprot:8216936-Pyramimonas_sp.AAC.1